MGLFDNLFGRKKGQEKDTLDSGLKKTKDSVLGKITRAIAGKSKVDDDVLDQLEEILVTGDVGVDTTLEIIERIQQRVARDKYINTSELNEILRQEVAEMLKETDTPTPEAAGSDTPQAGGKHPHVILIVGVNGVGKTTTIGKLAWQWKQAGRKVVLVAADTFRAAAIEQLELWGERTGVEVVKQQMGSDPAAVAFDGVQKAVSLDADIVIIDTAGRLHNKVGLMNELTKIRNVVGRVVPGAPHEILLVLDGSTGQNAYEQARQFAKATTITGMVITKLDGTAKGGVVLGISHQMQIPVRYIGLGEGMEDLIPFDRRAFVDSLFGSAANDAQA